MVTVRETGGERNAWKRKEKIEINVINERERESKIIIQKRLTDVDVNKVFFEPLDLLKINNLKNV